MSIDACALCAYGLWIYPEPEDNFSLELKDDILECVRDCSSIHEYVYDGYCDYDIPDKVEVFSAYNGHEEFLGISLAVPPWENSIKTKEEADAVIQKALEALYKDVPPDYAKKHCCRIYETWVE